MNTNAIDQRRRLAEVQWRELQDSALPFIYIGAGSCGLAAGAADTQAAAEDFLKERGAEARFIRVGCIGPCYLEPLMDVRMPGRPRISYSNVAAKDVPRILGPFFDGKEISQGHLAGHFGDGELAGVPRFFDMPMLKHQVRIVLRNCGFIDPDDLDQYLARDGYQGFEKALSLGGQGVLDEIKRSGLRGPGFPPGGSGRRAGTRRPSSATSSATPTKAIRARS
jgi:NADH-quinone oxidoreductase subunit F